MTRLLQILLTFTIIILPCQAQEQDQQDPLLPYSFFHEKKVRIQGLAWIQVTPKSNMVLLITPNAKIWLEPWTQKRIDEFKKWNGKLVEVTGILNNKKLISSPNLKKTYTYYGMENFTIRGLDQVEVEISLDTDQVIPLKSTSK